MTMHTPITVTAATLRTIAAKEEETTVRIDAPGYHGDYAYTYPLSATARGTYKIRGANLQPGRKIPRGVLQDMLAAGHWRAV